jgi:hypothetical protein
VIDTGEVAVDVLRAADADEQRRTWAVLCDSDPDLSEQAGRVQPLDARRSKMRFLRRQSRSRSGELVLIGRDVARLALSEVGPHTRSAGAQQDQCDEHQQAADNNRCDPAAAPSRGAVGHCASRG